MNSRSRFEDDDLLCRCRKVTAGELRRLVRGGLRTTRGLIARTDANTGCESCSADLEELLDEEVLLIEAEKRAQAPQLSLFSDVE